MAVQVQSSSDFVGLELQVLLDVRIVQDLFVALRPGGDGAVNEGSVEPAPGLEAGLDSGV